MVGEANPDRFVLGEGGANPDALDKVGKNGDIDPMGGYYFGVYILVVQNEHLVFRSIIS